MVARLLRLIGFDLQGKIAALEDQIGSRVEAATEEVKRAARRTALIAMLGAASVITALLVFVVGLIALYFWVADQEGRYVGLAVVVGVLVAVTMAMILIARSNVRKLSASITVPRPLFQLPSQPHGRALSSGERPRLLSSRETTVSTASPRLSRQDERTEALAALVTAVLPYPGRSHPVASLAAQQLAPVTHGATQAALLRATDMVRNGDRPTLLSILLAAGFTGYLISRAR